MPETLDHQALKRLAVAWLWRLGCRVVATEVRSPVGRFRIDVAGWFDRPVDGLFDAKDGASLGAPLWAAHDGEARRRGGERATTVLVECKQSRADFLRDGSDPAELLAERARLIARREAIEETKVKRFEPSLRIEGSSLFAELDAWDFAKSRMASYREVVLAIERIDEAIYGRTKFIRFARWRVADRLVLFAPAGLIRPRELPESWGLVECHRRPLRRGKASMALGVDPVDELPLRASTPPPALDAHPGRRERLFRSIAMAASREAVRRLVPEALDGDAQRGTRTIDDTTR
jgi:hypothetical protein